MKPINYRVSLVLIMFMLASTSMHAGTLDPPLSALAASNASSTGTIKNPELTPASRPFGPRLDAAGRVQVYIHPAHSDTAMQNAAELVAMGAVQILPSSTLHIIQAWVPVEALNKLAALPDVGRVSVPSYGFPRRHRVPEPLPFNVSGHVLTRGNVPQGLTIDSQALYSMQAAQLQAQGMTGSGIKIGVISDDNSGLAASHAAGYLPASVWADPSYPGTIPTPGDPAEGTAMLEEIYAMAPGVSLGFCAPQTSVEFLTCYNDFIAWGANVITDDLAFTNLDMFSAGLSNDGDLAYAVSQITQAHPDVAFTSSAGNDAQDYFQALYTPGPGATISGKNYASLMDFGVATGGSSSTKLPVTFYTTTAFTPDFEWNDPINTSPDVLDIYLVNSAGSVLASGTASQSSNGRAGESLAYTPANASETDYIEIGCRSCPNPVTLKLIGYGDAAISFGLVTGGSVGYGQSIAPGVMTTAAAQVNSQNPLGIFQEIFSATGPYLYGNYSSTNTIARPNLTGIDNVTVSGAGGFAASNPAPGGGVLFLGTSATGPNVGALIADLMSGIPGDLANAYYDALENTANQVVFSSYDPNAAGSGLGQGVAAWNSISPNPIPNITDLSPSNNIVGSAFPLTVNGIGFVSGSVVNFNGTALPTTVVNSTTLSATVTTADTATAGYYNVTVSNPVGNPSTPMTFTVNNPVPAITSFNPAYVMAGGAAFTLTVNGNGFVNGATVSLNGTEQPTNFVSATQLTVALTASDISTPIGLNVTIANPAPTTSTSNGFTFPIYTPVPILTGISPACAAVGGPSFSFTLTGSGFVSGIYGTKVLFNNSIPLVITSLSSTQLTAVVPSAAIGPDEPGTDIALLLVENAYGGPGINYIDQNYTVTTNNSASTLMSIDPTSATAGGSGFTLTINGSGFVDGSVVDFNTILLPTTFVSATQLTATVPDSAIATAGNYTVTIMNPSPGCGYSNSGVFNVQAPLPPPPPPPPPSPPPPPPPSTSAGGGGGLGLFGLLVLAFSLGMRYLQSRN